MGIIESTVNLHLCDKCGSVMQSRVVKLSTGEFANILQCTVCRHYIVDDNE